MSLYEQIEEVKLELYETINNFPWGDARIVRKSQELDKLLNKLHKKS